MPASLSATPEGYADWLTDLKSRIHTTQQRATLVVNRELVFALLADRAGHPREAGGTGLGLEGD